MCSNHKRRVLTVFFHLIWKQLPFLYDKESSFNIPSEYGMIKVYISRLPISWRYRNIKNNSSFKTKRKVKECYFLCIQYVYLLSAFPEISREGSFLKPPPPPLPQKRPNFSWKEMEAIHDHLITCFRLMSVFDSILSFWRLRFVYHVHKIIKQNTSKLLYKDCLKFIFLYIAWRFSKLFLAVSGPKEQ